MNGLGGAEVPLQDLTFWQGAGAAGITGFIALWIRKITKRESLEDRLQRWQEATVQRVQKENEGLRAEIGALKESVARMPVMEACLGLAVNALHRIAPGSPELRQIGALLSRSFHADSDIPDDMRELLDRIGPKQRRKR